MGNEFLLVDASDETGAYYAVVAVSDLSVNDYRLRAQRFETVDEDVPWKLESMSEEVLGVPFLEIRGERPAVIPDLEETGGVVLVTEDELTEIGKVEAVITGHVRMVWGGDGFCWVMNSKNARYLTQYVELEDIERAILGEDYKNPAPAPSLVMLAEQYLGEQCGQCDCYHPAGYTYDCRDDLNRFGAPEHLADLWAAAPSMHTLLADIRQGIQHHLGDSPDNQDISRGRWKYLLERIQITI